MTRRMNNEKVALAVGGGLLAAVGTAMLYYLRSGAGSKKNAVFIPDSIEERLDLIVDSLNHQFGHGWVNLAVSVLQAALPPPLTALVTAVHKAEEVYCGHSGTCKKQNAIRFASGWGYA